MKVSHRRAKISYLFLENYIHVNRLIKNEDILLTSICKYEQSIRSHFLVSLFNYAKGNYLYTNSQALNRVTAVLSPHTILAYRCI
jgi:hypothetical protein